MHKPGNQDPQPSINAGYEVSDMNARIIVITGIVLAASIVFSIVVGIVILRAFDRRGPINQTPGSPLTADLRIPPAGPLLQGDPVGDKDEILAEAARRLNEYGMLDDNPVASRAHIPIELALQLVAEGKVPYRQQPTTALLDAPAPEQSTTTIAVPAPESAPEAVPAAPEAPVPAPAPPAAEAGQAQVTP